MPSSPKFGRGFGEVRMIEISSQLDAQHLGYPPGDIGISREISENLNPESKNPGPQERKTRRFQRKNLIAYKTNIIGNNEFF
jgi:hypothetical protein